MSQFLHPIKCQNCNGDIKLDLDNLASYCPYCGSQLMIDISTLQTVLLEREKTKRQIRNAEIRLEKQKDENKNFTIMWVTYFIFILILAAGGGLYLLFSK